jgi:hypothetical protein
VPAHNTSSRFVPGEYRAAHRRAHTVLISLCVALGQIAALSVEQLTALSPKQLAALSPHQTALLTGEAKVFLEHIREIKTAGMSICWWSPEKLAAVPPHLLLVRCGPPRALSAPRDALSASAHAQESGGTPAVWNVPSLVCAPFESNPSSRPPVTRGSGVERAQALEPEQLAALSAEQLNSLPLSFFAQLTAEQALALRPEQIAALSPEATAQLLSAERVAKLDAEQVAAVSDEQLAAWSPESRAFFNQVGNGTSEGWYDAFRGTPECELSFGGNNNASALRQRTLI